MAEPLDRFRSFCERYIIERAGKFDVGREQEQAWLALQDAKKIYGMVAEAKNETDKEPSSWPAGQGAQQGTPNPPMRPGQIAYVPPLLKRGAQRGDSEQPAERLATTGLLQRMTSRLKGY
jgi:hypothetical protein